MARYAKVWLTHDQQLDLMDARGIEIGDREEAITHLRTIGYYRLSGYWYPFRTRTPEHREGFDTPSSDVNPGCTMQSIAYACNLDRQFRNQLWRAIERVEVAIRVAIAYQIGMKGGLAYLDSSNLAPGCLRATDHDPEITHFDEFCTRLRKAIEGSREDFAQHFREKYDGDMPIWAAIELWDFGTLARFYQIMSGADRLVVAQAFGLMKPATLGSWLQSLNILRNYCAHHSRLNRRKFVNSPAIPASRALPEFAHLRSLNPRDQKRLYPLLCVLSYLMGFAAPDSSWREDMADFIRNIDPEMNVTLGDYGIPDDWDQQELWIV